MSLELHVWGTDKVSVISPESLACAWLVSSSSADVDIIASNNTNMSFQSQLPVLIVDKNNRYEGYTDICEYVTGNYPLNGINQDLSKHEELLNKSIISFINNKLRMINQYNLYICSQNYEKYTRKLFKHYLPFPMMYNQPLKFYNQAQELTATVGLGASSTRFFQLTEESAPEDVIDTTTPISKLHEQTMLANNKKKLSLKETKNTLKAMNLLHDYIKTIEPLLESLKSSKGFTTGELLFYSYLTSLCWEQLPDQTLHDLIKSEHSKTYEQYTTTVSQLTVKPLNPAEASEIPSLYNEIKHRFNKIQSWSI